MPIGDADIASGVFFNAFGVLVTFSGQTQKCNKDEASQDAVFGEASVSDVRFTLLMGKNTFTPMPLPGQPIVVDGVAYKVKSSGPADDGSLIELRLKKP